MTPLPATPEMQALARRIIWFETPEQALADPIRFLAYAFRYARHDDMRAIRTYIDDDGLRSALRAAPSGIIDGRSWWYWHAMLGTFPPPSMPVRRFDNRPLAGQSAD